MDHSHFFLRSFTAKLLAFTLLISSYSVAAEYDLGEFELDEKQLKNTVYGQGFSIGLDEKTIDKLIEIQELLKQAQWVKAFRLIEENKTLWKGKQVPRKDGFSFPVQEHLWRLVASLPADALESFRLYFSPKANALLASSDGAIPNDELATLREIYHSHFFTKAGAKAANQLADALFQEGNFRRAAKIWSQIVDHHPTLPNELQIHCKRAIAYHRARDAEANADVLLTLKQRFADRAVAFGGKKQTIAEFIEAWTLNARSEAVRQSTQIAKLPTGKPTCSVAFGSSNDVTPGVKFENGIIYVNLGRNHFAYDAKTGNSIWSKQKNKKGNFLKLLGSIANRVQATVNPYQANEKPGAAELVPVTDRNHVFLLNFDDVKKPTMRALEKSTGTMLWEPTLEDARLTGNVIALEDSVIVAAYGLKTANELSLFSIGKDGEVRKRIKLGSVQPKSNPYQGTTVQPSPVLLQGKNYLFVLPGDGAVLAVEPTEMVVEWTFRSVFPKKDLANSNVMFSYDQQVNPYQRASAMIIDETLYFKDVDQTTVYAIDPYGRKVLWKRDVNKVTHVVGIDKNSVYALEKQSNNIHDIVSYDLKTNRLKNVFRLPQQVSSKIVNGPNGLMVSTNRGIYKIDKQEWEWDFPFRQSEFREGPSDLISQDGWLIAAGPQHLYAFPISTEQK